MSNKQVIAIFVIGVALLLGAFWAGLHVVNQDAATNANQNGPSNQKLTSKGTNNANSKTQQESSDARYVVQLGGSFGTAEKANEVAAQLRRTYPSAYVQNPTGSDTVYRVRIGPYDRKENAEQVANELASQGFKGVMIFPWKEN
jgi:cell division protein FtsN